MPTRQNLNNINNKFNDQHKKSNVDVVHLKLMLERLGIAHNYEYTFRQYFALCEADISLKARIWHRKHVEKYFEIMNFPIPSRISDIEEIKKAGGNPNQYDPKLVEKYVMPNLDEEKNILFKKIETSSKNN